MNEKDFVKKFEEILRYFNLHEDQVDSPGAQGSDRKDKEFCKIWVAPQNAFDDNNGILGAVMPNYVEVEHSIKLNKSLFAPDTQKDEWISLVRQHPDMESFLTEQDTPFYTFFHELAHVILGHSLMRHALRYSLSDEEKEEQENDAYELAARLLRAYAAGSEREHEDLAEREGEICDHAAT